MFRSTWRLCGNAIFRGSLYIIDESNIDLVLQNIVIPNEERLAIINLVQSGKVIVVPEAKVNIKDWFGIGYIALDTSNGSGAYMISGGYAGGLFGLAMGCVGEIAQFADMLTFLFTPQVALAIEMVNLISSLTDVYYSDQPMDDATMYVLLLSYLLGNYATTAVRATEVIDEVGTDLLPLASSIMSMIEAFVYATIGTYVSGSPSSFMETYFDSCMDFMLKLEGAPGY